MKANCTFRTFLTCFIPSIFFLLCLISCIFFHIFVHIVKQSEKSQKKDTCLLNKKGTIKIKLLARNSIHHSSCGGEG